MAGPMAGIRVVDVSNTFMVPYATLIMAQMGAEVVKIEEPSGDILRFVGDDTELGIGPVFLNVNRGKRSAVLNLKERDDYRRFCLLVERSDIFVHNKTPEAAKRLGIDYASLAELNARLIYCSASGYHSGGPYSDMPAYDDVIQAASGMASVQGREADPQYVRTAIADKTTGLFVLAGILAALFERERSGTGQAVEVPMFETMISYLLLEQQGGAVYEPPRGPTGYARINSIHRHPFRTADGLIGVMVYTDRQWRSFFELIDAPQLAADRRFVTMAARTANTDALYQILEGSLVTRNTAEWLDLLWSKRIPAMPVNSIASLLKDPQVSAVGLLEEGDHPVAGRIATIRLPIGFSRTPAPRVRRAPLLGEDQPWLEDLERRAAAEGYG